MQLQMMMTTPIQKTNARTQKIEEWALWQEAVIQKLRADVNTLTIERDALSAEVKIIHSELSAFRALKTVVPPNNTVLNDTSGTSNIMASSLLEWLTGA